MARTKPPSSPAPTLPPRESIITQLVEIELGNTPLTSAAAALGITEDALIRAVEADPTLEQEVTTTIAAMKADPELAVRRSIEGLNSVAAALAKRVASDSETMTTQELSQAGTLLDRISAVSAQRAAETKRTRTEDDDAGTMPVGGMDTRGGNLWMFCIQPSHPAARDARSNHRKNADLDLDEPARQVQQREWLDRWFPMDETGKVHDMARRIGKGGWWMTPDGKRHAGGE